MTRPTLTAEQVSFFHDNGYLLVQDLIDAAWLSEIRGDLDDLHASLKLINTSNSGWRERSRREFTSPGSTRSTRLSSDESNS